MSYGRTPESVWSCGCVRVLSSELLQQQLRWRPGAFTRIAALAARHHIAFGAASTARHWHDVIHREGLGRERLLAVGTPPTCQQVPPPLRGPQRFGFGFFAGHVFGVFLNLYPIGHRVFPFPALRAVGS